MNTKNAQLPVTITANPGKWKGCAVYGVYGTSSSGTPRTYGLGRFASLDEALAFAETVPATWVRPNGKTHTFTEIHICPMTYI